MQIIEAGNDSWMRTVLFHELSHLVFHQAMEGAMASAPSWLEEGLAMYNEPESRDSEDRVREAAEAGQLLRFSQLQGNFGADGPTVGLAYAQSEMLVTHLIDGCGRDGFQTFIRNMVDDDQSVDSALEAACGFTSETLYNDWRQTLPNAPALDGMEGSEESPDEGEEAAPPVVAPAAPPAEFPRWAMALALCSVCLMGFSGLGILYVIFRLLRPAAG